MFQSNYFRYIWIIGNKLNYVCQAAFAFAFAIFGAIFRGKGDLLAVIAYSYMIMIIMID